MSLAEAVAQEWRTRLQGDYPKQNQTTRESIIQWLIGEDPERFDALSASQLAIAKQAVEYRYRILRERYWGFLQNERTRNYFSVWAAYF